MFINILSNSLKLMKKNLNLTQLVFIFFIIMTLSTPVLATIKMNFKAIPFILIFFILICAIFAGLSFAFKKALDYETNPPKSDNNLGLSPLYFAEFFQGTGFYLKKFLLAGLVVVLLMFIFGFTYDFVLSHYVVIPEKILNANLNEILMNDGKVLEFVNSLSVDEQLKIGKIALFTAGVFSLFGFITMLYPVVLVSEEVNFLKSFWISLKALFKNLPISLLTFFFFNICLTFASILNAGVGHNIIISIIAILLQCYLNVWYLLTLFVYYEEVK